MVAFLLHIKELLNTIIRRFNHRSKARFIGCRHTTGYFFGDACEVGISVFVTCAYSLCDCHCVRLVKVHTSRPRLDSFKDSRRPRSYRIAKLLVHFCQPFFSGGESVFNVYHAQLQSKRIDARIEYRVYADLRKFFCQFLLKPFPFCCRVLDPGRSGKFLITRFLRGNA